MEARATRATHALGAVVLPCAPLSLRFKAAWLERSIKAGRSASLACTPQGRRFCPWF